MHVPFNLAGRVCQEVVNILVNTVNSEIIAVFYGHGPNFAISFPDDFKSKLKEQVQHCKSILFILNRNSLKSPTENHRRRVGSLDYYYYYYYYYYYFIIIIIIIIIITIIIIIIITR